MKYKYILITAFLAVCYFSFVSYDEDEYFIKGAEEYENSNYKQAAKWYLKAAEQGHLSAQHNLGYLYDNGVGVTQNYELALKWYKKAAEQGHASSQANLGLMYDNGSGTPRD